MSSPFSSFSSEKRWDATDFLQQWFDLSEPQAEDTLYDSEAMRRFAQVDLLDARVPDETTLLRFRHLLAKYQLRVQMFAAVKTLLETKRLLLKARTIVDATIVATRSSTKNPTKTRDPEKKQTRERNQRATTKCSGNCAAGATS